MSLFDPRVARGINVTASFTAAADIGGNAVRFETATNGTPSPHTINRWESTHGIGTEVSVVADTSDGTYMANGNGGAFEDLLYEFQKIDAPSYCPITSCVVTMRVFYPDGGAIMYSRARVGGIMHAGPGHITGSAPIVVAETDEWANVVTNVGLFNSALFGCYANWSFAPPALARLSASSTCVPPSGGSVCLVQ